MFSALAGRVVLAETVDALQALAYDVRPGIRDAAFRNQAPSQRDLPHQFACQRAPSERAAYNARDLRLLLDVADLLSAGGGDQEGHADLVDRQKGSVAREL